MWSGLRDSWHPLRMYGEMAATRWRILSTWDFPVKEEVLAPLREIADVVSIPATARALAEEIASANVYLASLHLRCDASMLERASVLRLVATPSTGLDHIDLPAASQRGIEILSLKDDRLFLDGITATAELTWALLLAVARRVPGAVAAARAGEWARDGFRGTQLSGKTFGVLGYGRLGTMVAEYAKSFRMRVLAHDVRSVEPAAGVEMVSFEALLAESDVLSLHIHLDEQNRGLIGVRELARMKPGAILLNTSRGAIVDEGALEAALTRGSLGGAGLDVIDGEWNCRLDEHPLICHSRTHENLVITPHIGGVTWESQRAAYERTVEKVIRRMRELPVAG